MLKLKFLYENNYLATMLINNFHFDDLDLIKHFRISSNAIYPFKYHEQVRFLRATPVEERSLIHLQGEIDLIKQLDQFPCLRLVTSREGLDIIEKNTPFGRYYASVFDRVPGTCLEEMDMTQELSFQIGRSLAQLHNTTINIEVALPNLDDQLMWMTEELNRLDDKVMLKHLNRLRHDLVKLNRSSDEYGIVHYDYELDNLFMKEDTIYAIDFNDAHYHFLTMDIVNALDGVDELYQDSMLNGYQEIRSLSHAYDKEKIWCEKYAAIYKYTRIKRSIHENYENEPNWMVTLRNKLKSVLFEIEYKLEKDISES